MVHAISCNHRMRPSARPFLSEIALSRLDIQWGFTDSTPVARRQVCICLHSNTDQRALYVSKSAP